MLRVYRWGFESPRMAQIIQLKQYVMVEQTTAFIGCAVALAVIILGCIIWVAVDRHNQNK